MKDNAVSHRGTGELDLGIPLLIWGSEAAAVDT